jgi:hypothetical protein
MHQATLGRWGFGWALIAGLGWGCGDDTAPSDAGPGNPPAGDASAEQTASDAPPAVPDRGTSAAALRAGVDGARYQADLELIAQPRLPGSAHWQAVQDLCADRLAALGYSVERQAYGTGVNVVGTRPGTINSPGVLVSAHYDHIADCPGADDNATGVAAVLEVARVLATAQVPGTLIAACWDEEEGGMVGSEAYAARAVSVGASFGAVVSIDMIGYASSQSNSQTMPPGLDTLFPVQTAQMRANGLRGDFVAVVADESPAPWSTVFARHAAAESLPTLELLVPAALKTSTATADLRRSDHASFWRHDLAATALLDTAEYRNPHYHCTGGPDVVSDLDLGFALKVVRATVGATAEALGLP